MAHRSRLAGFIIDCQTDDLDGAAAFWSQALGLHVADPDSGGIGRYAEFGGAASGAGQYGQSGHGNFGGQQTQGADAPAGGLRCVGSVQGMSPRKSPGTGIRLAGRWACAC